MRLCKALFRFSRNIQPQGIFVHKRDVLRLHLLRCLIPMLKCAAGELCGRFRHSVLSSNSTTTTKYLMKNWLQHTKTLKWSFFLTMLSGQMCLNTLSVFCRKLHPHKHIWCHFETCHAHPEKVRIVPTVITDFTWIFLFVCLFK